MSKRPVILAVDHDPSVRTFLYQTLSVLDIEVHVSAIWHAFIAKSHEVPASLYLIDLDLASANEPALAYRLRQLRPAPIVFLSMCADPGNRLRAFEIGAVDCLSMPIHPREFSLRVQNLLTSLAHCELRAGAGDLDPVGPVATFHRFGSWTLDLLRRCLVDAEGAPHVLTAAEFEVLALLTAAPHRTVTRDEMVQRLGSQSAARHNARIVDVLIWRLRKKLGDNSMLPRFIATVPSRGYVFIHAISTR